MSFGSSYLHATLSTPQREALVVSCPALALFTYQHAIASVTRGQSIADPLPRAADKVSTLLQARSVQEVISLVFSGEVASEHQFWAALRRAVIERVEEAVTPIAARDIVKTEASESGERGAFVSFGNVDIDGSRQLPMVPARRIAPRTRTHVLEFSRTLLKSVTASILAGSTAPLGDRNKSGPVAGMLRYAQLVVPESSGGGPSSLVGGRKEGGEITAEGLAFCMSSLQQQWWALLSAAMERAVVLIRKAQAQDELGVAGEAGLETRSLVLQLLAILYGLDSSELVFPFPERQRQMEMFHVVARLTEVGLAYPIIYNGERYFALSPHFHHALSSFSSAPLCMSAMLHDEGDREAMKSSGKGAENSIRREDEDTIITETNFRLYAYTRDPAMLNIISQFAERGAAVEGRLVCFRVTRHSFVRAVKKGISAAQILLYLSLKAHPAMLAHYGHHSLVGSVGDALDRTGTLSRTLAPLLPGLSRSYHGAGRRDQPDLAAQHIVVPQSFCDQLIMWEKECHRLQFHDSVVLLSNVTPEQASVICRHLEDHVVEGVVLLNRRGYMVLQRDAFERWVEAHLPPLGPVESLMDINEVVGTAGMTEEHEVEGVGEERRGKRRRMR